jgi:hypothetical protein
MAPRTGSPRLPRIVLATAPIDDLTRIAQRRYAKEVQGTEVHAVLRRVASDRALRGALQEPVTVWILRRG